MIFDTPIDQSNLELEKFVHFSDGIQSAGIGCTSFLCLLSTKCQLISKCYFVVFKSQKKKREILGKSLVVFLGDLKTSKGHFKIN